MNVLFEFSDQPVLKSVGWVLVHFVWQGTAVALCLALVLWMLKRSSANVRYLAGCTALGLMLACPVLTFVHLNGQKTINPTRPSINLVASGKEQVSELAVAEIGREPATPATQMAVPSPKLSLSAQLEPWLPWIAGLWASAVMVLSLRLFAGWLLTRKLRLRDNQPLGEELQELLARLCQQLQVKAPVQLLKSTLVEVPTVAGWLKPVILLPVSSLAGLSPSQLEAVLAHELAHIRRHDFLVNLLQSVAETLLFYHPGVWWVSGWIRQEREHCCDDITLQACGDRVEYARALATLEEMRNRGGELAMAAGGGELLPRIRRILGLPSQSHAPRWWLGGALAAVLMLLLIAVHSSRSWAADEKPIQIRIEVRATEANAEDLTVFALDKFPQSGQVPESTNYSNEPFAPIVLTEPQTKVIHRALEMRSKPEMLAHPTITTISGRQATFDLSLMNEPLSPLWTNWISDFVFSVVPFVAEDGFTHRLRVNHKTTIYDDPGPFQPNTNWAHLNQLPPPDSNPIPKAHMKSVTLSGTVWDGQTLALIGRPFVKGEGGQLKQISPLIFITPKVVDEAGEPVHHSVSLPFDVNSVPEQPDSQTLE